MTAPVYGTNLVTLRNGSSVHLSIYKTIMLNIKKLFDENIEALRELFQKCKNPNSQFNGNSKKMLEKLDFIDSHEGIDYVIKIIVLNAIEEEGFLSQLIPRAML